MIFAKDVQTAQLELDYTSLREGRISNILRTTHALKILHKYFYGNMYLFQLLSNVSSLRSSVNNMARSVSPFCQECYSRMGYRFFEDFPHILLACPAYREPRTKLYSQLGITGETTFHNLLMFILEDKVRIEQLLRFLHAIRILSPARAFELLAR